MKPHRPLLAYGATGQCCVAALEASGVPHLLGGRAHTADVLPVGAALDPEPALATLGLTARRVAAP